MHQNMVINSGHAPDLNPNNDRRFWVVGDPTKVTGVLDGDAVVEIKTDGTVAITAVIKQPGGLPILVEHCYGQSIHAKNHAEANAIDMRHGKRVRAVGHHLTLNYSRSTLALELQACTGLELVPMLKDRQ